jgi:lipopolysaccharide assembly outer membrane protein LptD (OstA)
VFFKEKKIDHAVVQGNASGVYRFGVATGDTTAAKSEVVKYDAPRIEFRVPQNRIVLEPKSHLQYRELELSARRVEFDSEKQTLIASGNPQLVDRGDEVTGHLMTYDLESRSGTIYQAETTYEKGLYHGERIRKVGENVLDVLNGSYSTCNLDEPHYHFSAHWMKIYLKDKLVAKPVVFYVKERAVLALPFWVFPIKPRTLHSGFLPQLELGFSNSTGQFVRNAGYY